MIYKPSQYTHPRLSGQQISPHESVAAVLRRFIPVLLVPFGSSSRSDWLFLLTRSANSSACLKNNANK